MYYGLPFFCLILVVFLTHSSEHVVFTLTSAVCPSEENAVVWYSLLPGPGYELFSINPYTGLITTTSYLDREQQQHYTLRGKTHKYIKFIIHTHSSLYTVWCKPIEIHEDPQWVTLILKR